MVAWPMSEAGDPVCRASQWCPVLCSMRAVVLQPEEGLHVSTVPLSYLASAFVSEMNSLCLLHILHSSLNPQLLHFLPPHLPLHSGSHAFLHSSTHSPALSPLCAACSQEHCRNHPLDPCSRPRELPSIDEVTPEKEVRALLAQTACAQ